MNIFPRHLANIHMKFNSISILYNFKPFGLSEINVPLNNDTASHNTRYYPKSKKIDFRFFGNMWNFVHFYSDQFKSVVCTESLYIFLQKMK